MSTPLDDALAFAREHYRNVSVRTTSADWDHWRVIVTWSDPIDPASHWLDGECSVSSEWVSSPKFPAQWRYLITGQT